MSFSLPSIKRLGKEFLHLHPLVGYRDGPLIHLKYPYASLPPPIPGAGLKGSFWGALNLRGSRWYISGHTCMGRCRLSHTPNCCSVSWTRCYRSAPTWMHLTWVTWVKYIKSDLTLQTSSSSPLWMESRGSDCILHTVLTTLFFFFFLKHRFQMRSESTVTWWPPRAQE